YRPPSDNHCGCHIKTSSETPTSQTPKAIGSRHHLSTGVVYFKDCPQQPNIPNYLLGLALMTLLMIPYVTLPCERDAAQPQEHPKGFKACLPCLINLFFCTWILAGDVWVFSVYQPNYDPAAADGAYCDKTLYTFAFWNAVWETFVILLYAMSCLFYVAS
uniref:Uncharacterized protein n=1 Tax=Sander lucioperca TaxID=283035 RepID=A0A8C9ZNA7_SANLU